MGANLPAEVAAFLDARIDSVPQMETLQLLHGRRGTWTAGEIASRIYLETGQVEQILRSLYTRQLVEPATGEGAEQRWRYREADEAQNALMERVAEAWRTQLIAVTRMIHAKASSPVLEFARAFDLKKDR